MAKPEPGDQYSAAMQLFCGECRKINFQRLSEFTASDIGKPGSKLLLAQIPGDPHLSQNNKPLSNCWLCSQRGLRRGEKAPECSIYVENA
jgi:hypothetical protein